MHDQLYQRSIGAAAKAVAAGDDESAPDEDTASTREAVRPGRQERVGWCITVCHRVVTLHNLSRDSVCKGTDNKY